MNFLLHLSIRRKLTLIIMMTSVVALLIACGAFAVYEQVTYPKTMARDLSLLADVIGANSTAALTFHDTDAARDQVRALRTQSHVVSACIYGRDGKPFATYQRADAGAASWPARAEPEGTLLEHDYLAVTKPIALDGESIGTLYIRSDLQEMRARIRRYELLMLAVLVLASLVALALASRLQGFIANPVLALAGAARRVTEERDFSVRARTERLLAIYAGLLRLRPEAADITNGPGLGTRPVAVR